MPRAKAAPLPAPPSNDDKLANSVDRLAEQVETLGEGMGALDERVAVLVTAIDDLRQEVEWLMRNWRPSSWEPSPPISSVPRDPLADDFGDRMNQVHPEDVPDDTDAEPPNAQGNLF